MMANVAVLRISCWREPQSWGQQLSDTLSNTNTVWTKASYKPFLRVAVAFTVAWCRGGSAENVKSFLLRRQYVVKWACHGQFGPRPWWV